MIRFFLRFVGLFLLAAGFIALVFDGTKSIAGNAIYMTKFEVTWNALHANSLQSLHQLVEQRVGAWLWDAAFVLVLNAPTWLVLGILGAILIVLGRKKRPLIGYARD